MQSPISIVPFLKNTNADTDVFYTLDQTPDGVLVIATTDVGITNIFYAENVESARTELQSRQPPNSTLIEAAHQFHDVARTHLSKIATKSLSLHISGTPFQHAVWNALLTIPSGTTTTYSALAAEVGRPHASRAVGTAVGANPVAILIPCHRVLPTTGAIGAYRWGTARKRALLVAEGAAFSN